MTDESGDLEDDPPGPEDVAPDDDLIDDDYQDPAAFVLPPADPARVTTPPPRRPTWLVPGAVAMVLVVILGLMLYRDRHDQGGHAESASSGATVEGDATSATDPDPSADATDTTLAPLGDYDGWVDPASSGHPFGDTVDGLLTFRGNPTRSYYGKGPVPSHPQILWSFPGTSSGGMCSTSSDEKGARTWCGSGWTGQPNVWENNGTTWVAFGAYDRAVHFLDAQSGTRLLPDFPTGDIIKGTVSVDPDGYPLLYTGSRDNFYRVLATDQPAPTELWKLWAYGGPKVLWNDDWDGSGLVIDDYLFEGGENSNFYIVKLNRGYDPSGKVTVDPKVVFTAPGYDADLLAQIPNKAVSIENSVAISGNTVYFANSGGLVQGWDITGLKTGAVPTRVFRFWTGDDTDASIVIDADGYLYVASEFERFNARSKEVGQIMKLDPRKPDDPVVWAIKDQGGGTTGVWGTPAIWKDMVYADTNGGRLLGIDRATGAIRWEKKLPGPTWQSPVVVDDTLIVGDCSGTLHAYDVSDTTVDPPEKWTVELSGCIESTPAVWKGRIFVGARGGRFYAIGDADEVPATTPDETIKPVTGPPQLKVGSKG